MVKELSLFRIFCYLFHCKRGLNVVNRCQYCTRLFVDTARISCDIETNVFFKKSELKCSFLKSAYSENMKLNVCSSNGIYTTASVIDSAGKMNFGVVH